MNNEVVIGVDIGTSSSKGVLAATDGRILATARRAHTVSRPHTGWAEMDADLWWDEFASICAELVHGTDFVVAAVGVSGMGPCVLVTDESGTPLRPAILYGIDARATDQIHRLTTELGGPEALVERCGSTLSTQAVGPKLAWIADHEPDVNAKARRLFMPSSWLVWNLTDAYVLDHHSASQSVPLYDAAAEDWYAAWAEHISPHIALPELRWPGEVAGIVTPKAAEATGLPVGCPVITGTVDAWAEAVSVGATNPGDLMLMYGTTMFLIATLDHQLTSPPLWATKGVWPGTQCLAGGMASAGAVTSWLSDTLGRGHEELLSLAGDVPPGSHGLLMLPYLAGERTPIADPIARGVIAGLSVGHGPGDLYRAALESVGFGVRHNVDAMISAGARPHTVYAVGGGAQGTLWTQIVSDITGLDQLVPRHTIGASLGAAIMAAEALAPVNIRSWNPIVGIRSPDARFSDTYESLYTLYRALYGATANITHALARTQQ